MAILWISIPVIVKGKFLQKIKDTQVLTTENWRLQHLSRSIQNNYSHAPYFKTYKAAFEDFYLNSKEVSLSQINYALFNIINNILGIKTVIRWSHKIPSTCKGRNERLIEICKYVGATDYCSGPSARGYLDELVFKQEKINIRFFNYNSYPAYHQLHGDFIQELSILDLIFNEGPNTCKFMKSFDVNNGPLIE